MVNLTLKAFLLDSGDVVAGEEVHECGRPITDQLVDWLYESKRFTVAEFVSYHRNAVRLNA